MADGGSLTPPYRGHHVRFETKQAERLQSKASWSQQVVQDASCCWVLACPLCTCEQWNRSSQSVL